MDTANRQATSAQLSRDFSFAFVTKDEMRAAVAAADQWLEDNALLYNAALPLAFRTTASPAQKALLLAYVARRRAGDLKAEGE